MLWLLSLTSTPEVGTNFWWLKARHLFWNDSLWEINHGSPIIKHCKQSKRPSHTITKYSNTVLRFPTISLADKDTPPRCDVGCWFLRAPAVQEIKIKIKRCICVYVYIYIHVRMYVCVYIYMYNDSLLKVLKGLQTWSPTYINKSINPRILTASRYLY